VFFGIPQMQEVRPNAISIENPEEVLGLPRYQPFPVTKRDENTGENPQRLYVRRMRGRLFVANDDMAGYDTLRVGRIRRTDRPGAVPECDELGSGPLLALQASPELHKLIASLADQVEAKDEVLAREAREHHMLFTDGVAANTEHLLKLHVLNEARAQVKAMLQSPILHPFELFVALARLVGHLSIFGEELVPETLPTYDHDHPGESIERLRARIVLLLDALRPANYAVRKFVRKKDERGREGFEVELDRKWIDDNLEIFVAFEDSNMEIGELERFLRSTFDMKLASPSRAPRIHGTAVSGLRFQVKPVPAGTLPRRQGLHYFKIDKTIGPDRTDYWKECEQERGIRMSMRETQMGAMERLNASLYVPLRGN
jgi:type VI secretion system protein ImpJ